MSMTDLAGTEDWIRRGRPDFLRICTALVGTGASAFAALYFVQPILPALASDFGITATQAGMSITVATIALAAGLVVSGPLSDAVGRKPVMLGALTIIGLLLFAMALAPSWTLFLTARALLGLVLGGVTAVILTYLAEETERTSLGLMTGYILAGNSIGGMIARLVVGVSVDHIGWRLPVAALGLIALGATAALWFWLPRSRHFEAQPLRLGSGLSGFRKHFATPGLPQTFSLGFLLMSGFVAYFNLVGFHLVEISANVGQTMAGVISLVFLPASLAAVAAGQLSDRAGPALPLRFGVGLALIGLALSLYPSLVTVSLGALFVCFGFFTAHSTAAGQVGRRARSARAQATALYQIAFYMGAAFGSVVAGQLWDLAGWTAVVGFLALLFGASGVIGRVYSNPA